MVGHGQRRAARRLDQGAQFVGKPQTGIDCLRITHRDTADVVPASAVERLLRHAACAQGTGNRGDGRQRDQFAGLHCSMQRGGAVGLDRDHRDLLQRVTVQSLHDAAQQATAADRADHDIKLALADRLVDQRRVAIPDVGMIERRDVDRAGLIA